MGYDENEMMIEYSEMTSFNFNSKEYQEVRKDFIECKDALKGFEWLFNNFQTVFKNANA